MRSREGVDRRRFFEQAIVLLELLVETFDYDRRLEQALYPDEELDWEIVPRLKKSRSSSHCGVWGAAFLVEINAEQPPMSSTSGMPPPCHPRAECLPMSSTSRTPPPCHPERAKRVEGSRDELRLNIGFFDFENGMPS